jgi:hypothetical protein
VFLIALGAKGLLDWAGAERENKARKASSRGYFGQKLSQEARNYEEDPRIEDGLADLHRQVDTQDFVLAKGEALSARAVAPPPRNCLTAYAYKKSSQSRIYRTNRQASEEIEGDRGRILLDPTGEDNHRSTRRNVPLGKTIPQERDC